MDKKNNTLINMFELVVSVCNRHAAVLNAYPPFPPFFLKLNTIVTAIGDASVVAFRDDTGAKLDKNAMRSLLEEDAFKLSGILVSYGRFATLPQLVDRSKYTKTQLKKMKEATLGGICLQLLEDGRENVAALAPYGINTPWLVLLRQQTRISRRQVAVRASLKWKEKRRMTSSNPRWNRGVCSLKKILISSCGILRLPLQRLLVNINMQENTSILPTQNRQCVGMFLMPPRPTPS